MEKAHVLEIVAKALLMNDKASALRMIRDDYPFTVVSGGQRQYTDKQRMQIYLRDRFTDRYSGDKLVNPGLLRLISQYFPEDFPYHPHGKYTACHLAFWEILPSLDHIVPIALGGTDHESNLVTTTMLHNSIKANWTLEQLQWSLRPIDANEQWDGLTGLFIRLVRNDPAILTNSYIARWYKISQIAIVG